MSLLDDASLIVTPNGYKASKLYSVKPTSGLGDMDVVRATTATRVNSSNLIESVAINVPRLDYTGGGCPSILVEPARTNRVLRSEEFDNASWTKTNTTITANSSTSPDGTSTADILVENSTSNVVFGVNALSRPSGLTLTTTYSVSFFAKKITRDFCYFNDFNGFQTPIVKVFFNLQTGLVGNTSAGVLNPKMENYGNGWYRCSFQFVATSAAGTQIDYRIASATTDNVLTYTGVIGQQAIAIWGAQFETGANATSYIPTTTATVTRNADVISKTGISSLIGQTEGTVFVDFNNQLLSSTLLCLNKNSTNSIFLTTSSSGSLSGRVYANSVSYSTSFSGYTTLNQEIKMCLKYGSFGTKLFINGELKSTNSTPIVFTASLSSINLNDDIVLNGNATIRNNSSIIFTTALTDAQCISLTTV